MVERIIKGSLNGYFYEGNRELNIIVLGGSKGAELSLLLSTLYEEIKGVVVFTPSFYCFQGVNPMKKVSSWMFRGEEIPYVKYRLFSKSGFTLLKDMLLKKKLVLRDMYADAIKYARNREEARIKIEKTQAKYLMFAGDDDKMWPSDSMILEMLNYRKDIQYKIYEGVGHVFGGDVQSEMHYFGGNKEKNIQADNDALKIAGEFIESFL